MKTIKNWWVKDVRSNRKKGRASMNESEIKEAKTFCFINNKILTLQKSNISWGTKYVY